MARPLFPVSADYVQSIQGLHRLHALAVAGKDQTPEAEAVRDSLDQPWNHLTEVEKTRISGLSEDLYSISEPPGEVLPRNPQAQRKLKEAIEARHAGEWDKALELLRRWGRYLEPSLLSSQRGSVWNGAGDFATAALFFRHSAELEPTNAAYAHQYLDALSKSDPEAALSRARETLAADHDHEPALVFTAAGIVAMSTRDKIDVDVGPILRELIRVLGRALERSHPEDVGASLLASRTRVGIIALLGFCYYLLGDSREALRYYNMGLASDPENAGLLAVRGIVRYGVDPGAVADFQQSIVYGFPRAAPYFYLAHHHINHKKFNECMRMCETGLTYPASNAIRGHLHEWLAISRSELGFPPDRVRSEFEAAIRLAPDNERIRRNFETFAEREAGHSDLRSAWEEMNESAIQAFGRIEFQPVLVA